MSDRLALANAIEDAGIPREKAESVATAIARFVEGNVATKWDVRSLGAELKADIAEMELRLLLRLGGWTVALFGLLFAALHLWPPHG